ncbi:4'-phosphopantetheinyl transferase family protein [Ideonella sp. BN130291]|uniref:4'-phosphopantetheinyl transferase family protein n=1 Tax=Ideonella sp. BN130291 TaxID=3112940 RepID=UPI002E2727BB|nr:4'-phosphopantetheinyl transferase superfamily protein [Ideonella sp. BN130291]
MDHSRLHRPFDDPAALARRCTLPAPGDVQLWLVHLPSQAGCEPLHTALLMNAEMQKVNAKATAALRQAALASRATLRMVLGGLLGIPASEVAFTSGHHGKPALAACHRSRIEFNLSHSGDYSVIAVTDGQAVGVDIEQVRPVPEWREIAASHFSPRERRVLEAGGPDAFFALWTGKEALIKATGDGLVDDLPSFDSAAEPGASRWEACTTDATGIRRWSLCTLDVPPGYAGCLAIEGALGQLQFAPGP